MIPQLRGWHDKYEAEAVVQDNDSAIWRRFGIWAWPTALLVDRKGIVRYQHIGEGAYEETESLIRRLLIEKE
ncbi:MAG: hypothetical protein AAB016_08335 [candidate division NC10 bacterium]